MTPLITPMYPLIHPTAVIHPGADLHPTVQVGAYAVIGEKVTVGAETTIGAHVVLDGWTQIGAQNQIFPSAIIGMAPQDQKFDGSESRVQIGNGNLIREFVTINRATGAGEATIIGNNNLLLAYVHVAHNCVIEDQVVITNAASLAGHIRVESRARIGGMVGIHQFVQIGRYSMIGAMGRIDRDVPPYMLVEGHPARVRSLNLVGLKRAGLMTAEDGRVYRSLKQAFRLLYRSGLTLNEALEKLDTQLENEHLQHLHQFLRQSQVSGRRGPTIGRRKGEGRDEA